MREAAWLARLTPLFARYGATPPTMLHSPYRSFADDPAMLALLLDEAPAVVSFHFGLPDAVILSALRGRGIALVATATNLDEALRIQASGIDAVVAQGIEAGGHRGAFDPDAPDDALGMAVLTRLLVRETRLPVIAAGGLMDGAGIAAALRLGAVAAQLGTAFIACPESAATPAHRTALTGPAGRHTVMTSLISGRPARALPNRFTELAAIAGAPPPAYPIAYDAGKALHAAAMAQGDDAFAAAWAGQGAPMARALPAAVLVDTLIAELAEAGR